jgi:hypothetical protein
VALQQTRRKPVRFILAILFLVSLMVLGLPRPAFAVEPPPAEECNRNTMDIERQWQGVWWVCRCYGQGVNERWKWYVSVGLANNQRGKNREYLNDATNSIALINSAIVHHVGGYGNFGHATIQIYGTSGNWLSRPIAVRIIVGRWTGSGWQACHDSNWQYAPTNRPRWSIRQPANCGPSYYRAQSAGRYWSNSLGRWLTTGWTITESLCISPSPCGLAPPASAQRVS